MRKTAIFVLLLLSLQSILYARDRLRIAILDFEYPYGIEAYEAEQISEIIRTGIIVTGTFNVLEKTQVDKLFKESGFQLTGLVRDESVVTIGEILEADYLVVGSIGRVEGLITVTARLVSVETGENLYSEKLITTGETIFSDLDQFSKALANQTVESTYGVTLENIRQLVRMRNYEAAFQKLQVFRENYPGRDEVEQLEEQIYAGFAEDLYKKARFALRQGYYKQAASYTEQMFRYDPDKSGFRRFKEKLETVQQREEKKEKAELLREVRGLINKHYLDAAKEMLDEYVQIYGVTARDDKMNTLYTRINEEKAEEHYVRSKRLLQQKNYERAIEEIQKALERRPEHTRYINHLKQVHNRKNRSEVRTYKSIHKPPFFSIGFRYPFLIQASSSLMFYDDPYDELYIEGVFPSFDLEARIFSRFVDPIQLNYIFKASFSFGDSEREEENFSYRTSFLSPTISAGFGAAGTLAYVDLGLYVDIYGGVLHRETVRTVFGREETEDNLSFIFGPGINAWASWYISGPFQLFFRYRVSWLFVPEYRATTNHTLSLGAGVNF